MALNTKTLASPNCSNIIEKLRTHVQSNDDFFKERSLFVRVHASKATMVPHTTSLSETVHLALVI